MLLDMKYGSQTNNPLILKWKPPGGTTIKAYKVAENIRQHTKEKTQVWKKEKCVIPKGQKSIWFRQIDNPYVNLIRACKKVLYHLVYIGKKFVFLNKSLYLIYQ